jgi:hypothetical protein
VRLQVGEAQQGAAHLGAAKTGCGYNWVPLQGGVKKFEKNKAGGWVVNWKEDAKEKWETEIEAEKKVKNRRTREIF